MIHISEPDLNGNEEKYLLDAFRSGWLSKGEFNIRLEKELGDYFRRETMLTSSGTTALHLLLLAYGISSGDEVIVSAQSFAATANAVLYTGAEPIFVDVDPETWNIDPSKIESAITPKTKAILVTHLFGNPCDVSEIQGICKRYSLLLFEDAAEAIGAKYRNQLVGTLSDGAIFSLYGNKTVSCGEGGIVVCNNESIISIMRHLRDQAMVAESKYDHDQLGFNYRMTHMQAAIALAQFERLDEFVQNRKRVFERYQANFKNSIFSFQQYDIQTVVHGNWMFSVVNSSIPYLKIREVLIAENIETRPFFKSLNTLNYFADQKIKPVSEKLREYGVCLPTYPLLKDHQIDRVSEVLLNFKSTN